MSIFHVLKILISLKRSSSLDFCLYFSCDFFVPKVKLKRFGVWVPSAWPAGPPGGSSSLPSWEGFIHEASAKLPIVWRQTGSGTFMSCKTKDLQEISCNSSMGFNDNWSHESFLCTVRCGPCRTFRDARVQIVCFENSYGTSLVAQWLRLCTSSAGGRGSILGQGTNIPHGSHGQKKKKEFLWEVQRCGFVYSRDPGEAFGKNHEYCLMGFLSTPQLCSHA